MRWFRERDVRRTYDLLQHGGEVGLTQLKAMDGSHVIGVGLFDNEEDFVSECRRYNRNGILFAGVNPRSTKLVDDYGGLLNRMRTLFTDVAEASHVSYVTGVAASEDAELSDAARPFASDATVLSGGHRLFALDRPVPVAPDAGSMEARVSRWLYGKRAPVPYSILQFVPVAGTALAEPGRFRRRHRFVRYRPYFLDGLARELRTDEDEAGETAPE